MLQHSKVGGPLLPISRYQVTRLTHHMHNLFMLGPFVFDNTPVHLKLDHRSVRGIGAMRELMRPVSTPHTSMRFPVS